MSGLEAVIAAEARDAASPFASASAPFYAVFAGTLAIVAMLFTARGLSVAGLDFPVVAIAGAMLVMAAWSARARGWHRIATLIETWTVLALFCIVATLLSYGVATAALPLTDGLLATADTWLMPWTAWPDAMRGLQSHPLLMAGANACYASIGWQPSVLLLACVVAGRADRCWLYLLAWMATLLMVVAVTALMPAVGPYAFHGVDAAALPAGHDPAPWVTPGIVAALREGSLRVVGFANLEGIVTFPSFHAGAAVLLGWGFWPIRLLRWPMATLNAAMLLAAVPIGGHYFVDLPAGAAVAVLGICLATRWQAARSAPS